MPSSILLPLQLCHNDNLRKATEHICEGFAIYSHFYWHDMRLCHDGEDDKFSMMWVLAFNLEPGLKALAAHAFSAAQCTQGIRLLLPTEVT